MGSIGQTDNQEWLSPEPFEHGLRLVVGTIVVVGALAALSVWASVEPAEPPAVRISPGSGGDFGGDGGFDAGGGDFGGFTGAGGFGPGGF